MRDRRLDRVVVITGASSGIGRATAVAFGERGARVVLAARNGEALEAAAKEVNQGSNMPHDADSMAKARQAFMNWAGRTGPALVDPGAPIRAARTVSAEGTKDGLADGPFNGWSVIEAADLNAAAKLLGDHPFIGRGGTLQINEPASI